MITVTKPADEKPLCDCGRPAVLVPTSYTNPRYRRKKGWKLQPGGAWVPDGPICARCLRMDGRTQNYYDVVSALRDFGRLAPYEIALVTGIPANNVSQMLSRMRKAGIVERIEGVQVTDNDNGINVAYRLVPDKD